MKILILTGLSGSGKSVAVKALEDIDFFCVDNLPIYFIEYFLRNELLPNEERDIAIVVDTRCKGFIENYERIFSKIKKKYQLEIIYFEASVQVLLQRFSETRHKHPLDRNGNLIEAIRNEHEIFEKMRHLADKIIDTSTFNVHELKKFIFELYGSSTVSNRLFINLTSFGYKYGIPLEAEIVLDVRFLPNPHFIKNLKFRTGLEKNVSNYIFETKEAKIFLNKFTDFLNYLIPLYSKEGKSYLNIAIGCTGGKHRSVAVSEYIFSIFQKKYRVRVNHRDIRLP